MGIAIKLVTDNHLCELAENQADAEKSTESTWFVRAHWRRKAGEIAPEGFGRSVTSGTNKAGELCEATTQKTHQQ